MECIAAGASGGEGVCLGRLPVMGRELVLASSGHGERTRPLGKVAVLAAAGRGGGNGVRGREREVWGAMALFAFAW